MLEVANLVTMKGNPVTLLGGEVKVGQSAPDFTVTANDLSNFTLSSLKGKKVVISVVPSLDTPVCDQQTKRFNDEAAKLGSDVVILTISMDLPFAQKRWCGASNASNVKTFSDHRNASFGQAYGVLIKDLRLLTRAIFLIDSKGILRYKQIVKEITSHPDYDEVLRELKKI